jgi:hypothetical protein
MIFEFLIIFRRISEIDILEVIRECLSKVLNDNLNEFDDAEVERMIIPRIERMGDAAFAEDGTFYRQVLFGFALEFPEETDSLRIAVDEFAEAINASPVMHLVKFDDPLIRVDLAKWSDEIYALEMKLRRVLTFVYLHAYQDGDPYELLQEETVQPMKNERPQAQEMQARFENQFFHLTFSQYVNLNRRPEFKLPDLLRLVRDKQAYEGFREELARAPVEDENDAVMLAGLKERMEAIEAMRNCCAHSRRPSKKVEENYRNARPLLDQLLDDYLSRWEWQEPDEELIWNRAAREAVENALERAEWDEANQQMTLFDRDDDRIYETVTTREQLNQHLSRVASSAFYVNAPRADGEHLNQCDEYGIIEAALKEYEERLEEFFRIEEPVER